jgi:type VI secretion system (T6SS) baseplate-like injector VgrG
MTPKFYGKYRGKVEGNVDPLMQGRIQVSCPAVLGDGRMAWAMPAAPFAGPQVGLFLVPPQNANVWVEFEEGDPDSPIWAGCFWGQGEVPATPAVAETKILKTDSVTVQLSDLSGGGGLTIEVKPPAVTSPLKIALTAAGIELSNGKSKVMLTTANVDVNDGALQVM